VVAPPIQGNQRKKSILRLVITNIRRLVSTFIFDWVED
jgi:hypothetical protein